MALIGELDTRIEIKRRKEIGDFSDDFSSLSGGTVGYECLLETWAKVEHVATAKKFNGRAVGTGTGSTIFEIRNPRMELEKDDYIDAKGYRYKIEGTMPIDPRHKFIQIDTIFVGGCDEEA